MEPVQLFCHFVAQRQKTGAGDFASDPAFHQLMNAGLINDAGVVQSIHCDDCDHPHDAAVLHQNGSYGYFCPDLGFVSKARSELAAFQPCIAAFIAKLANDLNCKRRKSTPVSGSTWRVGSIATHAGDIVIYFHPVLQDEHDLNDLRSALALEVKASFAVILTATGVLSLEPYTTVSLPDCLTFDAQGNRLKFSACIETIVGIPIVNTGGRPNQYKRNIEKIMMERNCEGLRLEGLNAEAKAIKAEYQTQFPNESSPSITTIKSYLSNG